jgi:hypothetical protein
MTDFEKFMKDRGFEFLTDEALYAGYDRAWKSKHDILITQDEFRAEANCGRERNAEKLKEVYDVLAGLVNGGKLSPGDVYGYARFKWCLESPAAVVAYKSDRDKWEVNNCETEISTGAARIAVNDEWGFEASRIKIIGTPYYDATDFQFIRFDCAHMCWLWTKGYLFQVYE